jgi:alkylhydroperoxidase family enzyme
LHQRYKDRVQFLAVYVREAHPTDGWRMQSNDRFGISFKQPRTAGERTSLAKTCCSTLEITMPLLVDTMDDRIGHAYSGMPDRLYVIDREGKVAYKAGRGPFGFKPGEMEQSLVMLLLDQPGDAKTGRERVPALKDKQAWKRLPPAAKGAGQPLPVWARMVAATLPQTTAAMLELDYLHRARSPLDAKLRAKMRWVAAHANRCTYTEAYAAADLRRAGVDDKTIRALAGDFAGLPATEKAALAFARKLSLAADTVSDEEMAGLIKLHGDKQVVAMVLLLAYANFQDRLIGALGSAVEEGGPLSPREIRFAPSGKTETTSAAPRTQPGKQPLPASDRVADKEWRALNHASLQQALDKQRARKPRIRVPAWEEVLKRLPSGYPAKNPVRIKWSRVCMGYQPELAFAWFACTRAFAEEAKQDRVFEESLFWVITRELRCFY